MSLRLDHNSLVAMNDFATEIICCQQNSSLYPAFGLYVGSVTSYDSSLSTTDSEVWSTPKILSPNESMSMVTGEYKWCNFARHNSQVMEPTESEYKFYTPRRVSSLKTNRTPPGTPKSKAVRFADALGLDLEDVRHIFNLDLPPKIPDRAVQHLVLESHASQRPIVLVPNFSQPGAASDFLRRVKMHNVALENVFINDNVLFGTVRVMNITFDKRVAIRVSFNEWFTYVDFNASYVQDSHDGVTDRFSFSVLLPLSCQTYGNRIQLAVLYECSNGAQYWDNNFGQNYVYNCVKDS